MDFTTAGSSLSNSLEPIAAFFRTLELPGFVTHWGHPAMMGTVVFAMGGSVAFAGWKARLSQDSEVIRANLSHHSLWAKLMFLFITLGYTGGLLSLVMQGKPLLSSPHFWTGSVVIGLLSANGLLSLFLSDRAQLRTAHAYLGSSALGLMFVHALLGLKLGLSF